MLHRKNYQRGAELYGAQSAVRCVIISIHIIIYTIDVMIRYYVYILIVYVIAINIQ